MLLELLPKALPLPKTDGLLVVPPNDGAVPNAGVDPLAEAARDPNPPPLLVVLAPKVDDPKTGPGVLGADAASAPNPLLLVLLPKAGVVLPLPSFEGLPKTGAEVLVVLLLLLPPRTDGLPNTGPEPALDAPKEGVVLVLEEPNPPFVPPNSTPPEGLALNAENGLAFELVLAAPKVLLLPPRVPVDGFPKGEGVVPNPELLVPPNMGVLLDDIPNGELEDVLSSPLPNDGTSFPESSISPQAEMTTSTTGFCDELVSTWLNASRPSIPSSTSPKTTCLPFRYGTGLRVKKNCEELVFFPLLAIERSPCFE